MKGNQPTLLNDLRDSFESLDKVIRRNGGTAPSWLKRDWEERGVTLSLTQGVDKGHGRREARECRALSDPRINGYAGSAGEAGEPWPNLAQILQVKREREVKGKTTTETVYLITSLTSKEADARLLFAYNRAHWSIENRLHWVRDEPLREDRSQIRTGAAPQMIAALRNLLLTALRRNGVKNIAAALRTYAARPYAAVALLLSSLFLQ